MNVQEIAHRCDDWATYLMAPLINTSDNLYSAIKGKISNEEKVKTGFFDNRFIQITTAPVKILFCALRAIVGAAVYGMGRAIREDNYFHVKGDVAPVKKDKIKVTTHNIGHLWGSAVFDGTAPRTERSFDAYDADIVFIQEAFGRSAHALADTLKKDYAHICYRGGGNLVGLDSGLLIASKVDIASKVGIESVKYYDFTESPLARSNVQFGFFVIETPNAIFVNTHIDVGNGENNADLHTEQFQQIEEAVEDSGDKDVYICGDLNLTEDGSDRRYIGGANPGYNESKFNVLLEWETGESMYEPLDVIAADDPVTCAIYAKETGLLNEPRWRRFKLITKCESRLLRMTNQAKLHLFRRSFWKEDTRKLFEKKHRKEVYNGVS